MKLEINYFDRVWIYKSKKFNLFLHEDHNGLPLLKCFPTTNNINKATP